MAPAVVDPARVLLGDPPWVTDGHGTWTVLGDERRRSSCGLVGRLAHHLAVAGVGLALGAGDLLPATRTNDPGATGLGSQRPPLFRLDLLAGLRVFEVQVLLGPERPARDEERLVANGNGGRVDDAEVDAGNKARLCTVPRALNLDPSGEVDEEFAVLLEELHLPDGLGS